MDIIELLLQYHKARSYAPEVYAKHIVMQQIGHCLGWNSINYNLPPRGVSHNSFICLLGKSGNRKSTAQEDTIGELTPDFFRGPRSFSPEGLLSEMSGRKASKEHDAIDPRSKLLCHMGEFSIILRSIKNGGNAANFKEISNELYNGRMIEYKKKLVNNEYRILKPYLSLSTTCTEEEFFLNVTPDMVSSGFLPRWLLVYSDKPKRRRFSLPDNIDDINIKLKEIILSIYSFFEKNPIKFEMSKEADDLLYDIQCELEDDKQYENIQPFVTRYINYIVKYADIYQVSKYLSNFSKLSELSELSELSDFSSHIYINNEPENSGMSEKSEKSEKSLVVEKDCVEQSIRDILPCLDYAQKLYGWINEDYYMRKVLKTIDGKTKISRSDLLHDSKVSSVKLDSILRTLQERKDYTIEYTYAGEGKARKATEWIKKIDGEKNV